MDTVLEKVTVVLIAFITRVNPPHLQLQSVCFLSRNMEKIAAQQETLARVVQMLKRQETGNKETGSG